MNYFMWKKNSSKYKLIKKKSKKMMFFKLSLALTLDTHFLGACLGSASFKFNVRRLQRLSECLFTACNYEAIIYLELVKIFRFQLWCYCSAHYLVTIVGSSNLSQDTLDCLIRLCVNHFKYFLPTMRLHISTVILGLPHIKQLLLQGHFRAFCSASWEKNGIFVPGN